MRILLVVQQYYSNFVAENATLSFMNHLNYRFTVKKCAVMACALLAVFMLTTCGDDDSQEPKRDMEPLKTLFEQISENPELSLFKQALVMSGYEKKLSEEGAMTVFALNNEEMRAYLDRLTEDAYSEIVKRHIVTQALTAEKMANDSCELMNLLGEPVAILYENDYYQIFIDLDSTLIEAATIRDINLPCANGYLNILSNVSFVTYSDPVVQEDSVFVKVDVEGILKACYRTFALFEQSQLSLEGLRINPSSVHSLTSFSSPPLDTYTLAYQLINFANILINNAQKSAESDSTFSEKEIKSIVAQAKCMRGFTYYNLAMLWGNVVYYTDSDYLETEGWPNQIPQTEVYEFAYNDILEALDDLPDHAENESDTITQFIRNTALMQRVEMALSLGRYDDAINTLNGIDKYFHFGFFNQYGGYTPVFTPQYQALYLKEAQGNTDGLETEWEEMIKTSEITGKKESCYGYWAALKRLGKAEEITGCYDYELLMPFSHEESIMNPKLQQNPGY